MIKIIKNKVKLIGKDRIVRLSKESTILLLGQVISIISSIVLVKILSNNLIPQELGNYSLALTIGTLVCQITFSYTMPGIARYFSLAIENEQQDSFFKTSFRLLLQSSSLSLIIGIVIILLLSIFGNKGDISVSILAILLLIISNFNTIFTEFQNMARQRHIAVFHNALDSILKIFLILILFKLFVKKGYIVLIASIFSLIIVLISQKYYLKKLLIQQNNRTVDFIDWSKKIKNYSIPFLYFNFFTGLQASADRWSLDYFTSRSEVGLYAPLTQLGYTPLLIISGLTTTLFGPILFKKSGDGSSEKKNIEVNQITNKLAFVSLVITVLVFIFTYFFHGLIFYIFVNKNYYAVSYLLPWMVLSGGFFSTGQIYSLKLMSDLNTKSLIIPKITTSLLGVLLSILGAYFSGIKGIVFCSLIFSTVQLIWIGLLSNIHFLKPILNSNKQKLINEKL